MKFSTDYCHIKPFRRHKFHENRCSESHVLLRDVKKLCPIFCIFPSDMDIVVTSHRRSRQNLLGDWCEVHENRCSDSHILLEGVSEFQSVLLTFIVQCKWKSVQAICTWCCWAFLNLVNIGAGKVGLLLLAPVNWHKRVHRKQLSSSHFQSHERLDKWLYTASRSLFAKKYVTTDDTAKVKRNVETVAFRDRKLPGHKP